MLVLTRQRDESIMIGDDIEILIVDVRGDRIRLGIKAPKEIPVHRKEIYHAIQKNERKKYPAMPKVGNGPIRSYPQVRTLKKSS